MFTETNKGFTIITNFGCNNNCKYCISKYHPILQNNITLEDSIDWEYLEHTSSRKVSHFNKRTENFQSFYKW